LAGIYLDDIPIVTYFPFDVITKYKKENMTYYYYKSTLMAYGNTNELHIRDRIICSKMIIEAFNATIN